MDADIGDWMQDEAFLHGISVVKNLQRGVQLITEFNTSTTPNEEQKQYLLQIEADHRKNMPVISKNTIFLV